MEENLLDNIDIFLSENNIIVDSLPTSIQIQIKYKLIRNNSRLLIRQIKSFIDSQEEILKRRKCLEEYLESVDKRLLKPMTLEMLEDPLLINCPILLINRIERDLKLNKISEEIYGPEHNINLYISNLPKEDYLLLPPSILRKIRNKPCKTRGCGTLIRTCKELIEHKKARQQELIERRNKKN